MVLKSAKGAQPLGQYQKGAEAIPRRAVPEISVMPASKSTFGVATIDLEYHGVFSQSSKPKSPILVVLMAKTKFRPRSIYYVNAATEFAKWVVGVSV